MKPRAYRHAESASLRAKSRSETNFENGIHLGELGVGIDVEGDELRRVRQIESDGSRRRGTDFIEIALVDFEEFLSVVSDLSTSGLYDMSVSVSNALIEGGR